jgi:hypothetical protein
MEFTVKKVRYIYRFVHGQIAMILLVIGLIIYFVSQSHTPRVIDFLLPLAVLCISFIRYEHWYRFYITRILINTDTVIIEVLDRNRIREHTFKIDELDVILDKAFTLGSLYKLIFEENKKKVFVQYQHLEWEKEVLMKVFNEICSIKTLKATQIKH